VLQRALTHAKAGEDAEAEGWCLHLSARLAFVEGNPAFAVQLEQQAQARTPLPKPHTPNLPP
jgi:hypothetical protein